MVSAGCARAASRLFDRKRRGPLRRLGCCPFPPAALCPLLPPRSTSTYALWAVVAGCRASCLRAKGSARIAHSLDLPNDAIIFYWAT